MDNNFKNPFILSLAKLWYHGRVLLKMSIKKKYHFSVLLFVAFTCFISACQQSNKNKNALFESLKPSDTGVLFANKITTSDSLNLLNFEYIYIGGGVGIGDFNADGFSDIFLTGNMVPSKLYLNKGSLQFEDITKASGIKVKGWAFGVSIADVNGDGLQDIYVSMGGNTSKGQYEPELFINKGNDKNEIPQFEEQAKEYGLNQPGIIIQSVFFDYDKDGDLDLYSATGSGYDRSPIVPYPIIKDGSAKNTDRLFRNDFNESKGHAYFTNVSKEANIVEEGFGLGVSILDLNEDTFPDIYVTNDYLSNDLLYINNQKGGFTNMASSYFNHTSHNAMGNDVGDINNDGLMDLISVDMLPEKRIDRMQMLGVNSYDKFYYAQKQGYLSQYMRNTLQLNQGNGKFSEIGQLAGIYKTSWSWTPLFADFDNDGYQDLLITNGFGKDVTDLDFVKFRMGVSVYTNKTDVKASNDKGLFEALNKQQGIKKHPYLYKNNHDNTFADMSSDWGFDEKLYSNGAAYADLDNDGDLEIITNNIDDFAHIYKNNAIIQNKESNFLRVKLEGSGKNKFAIGSTAIIKYGKEMQVRYLSTVRGFESSVEQTLHFGLGNHTMIDTLKIIWADGKITIKTKVKSNQILKLDYQKSSFIVEQKPKPIETFFEEIDPKILGINYLDNHEVFNDFNYERLLPRKYSENGQGIAVGDVNNDGLEDFFIGGGFQRTGQVYIQDKKGKFSGKPISTINDGCLDAGSLFFDADNDQDLDLYVVSGGNQFSFDNAKYQDRLYLNNGKGDFKLDNVALPKMISSGSCVVASDYDKDGDMDLFVGGGVKPGFYPTNSNSYLLQNDKGHFTDVTVKIAPNLQDIGIVTSALFTDVDNDNKLDLMVCGEYMPITIYKNLGKTFENITPKTELKNTDGWWQSLISGDFDNDSDMDYIAGNWGLNTPYSTSAEKPMTINFEDFDNNGTIDPILSYYENDILYPSAPLDYMVEHMPFLKKKFLNYIDYAKAPSDKVLEMFNKKNPTTLFCKTLSSVYLENKGNLKFQITALPQQAQLAPLFGLSCADVNNDGNLDLLGVGNFYHTDVTVGKYDAQKGLVLLGDGKGNFKSVSLKQSGFIVDSDARALARIETVNNQSMLLSSQVNNSMGIFEDKSTISSKKILPIKGETSAFFELINGKKRKVELNVGSGYLSQSSSTIVANDKVKSVIMQDANGRKTREINQ